MHDIDTLYLERLQEIQEEREAERREKCFRAYMLHCRINQVKPNNRDKMAYIAKADKYIDGITI